MVYLAYVASFFVLCVVGLANAGYLTWKHYQRKPLVCPLDHKCDVVTESKWSHLIGVRNEVLGLLFFIGMIFGMIAVLIFSFHASFILFLLFIGTLLGSLFSLFLLGVQVFVIRDYCFYCMISALITLLLCVNTFVLR